MLLGVIEVDQLDVVEAVLRFVLYQQAAERRVAVKFRQAGPDHAAALIEQLAPGGRIVIPIEERGRRWAFFGGQQLCVLTKDEAGKVARSDLLPVAFVPLLEGIVEDG